MIRRVLLGAGLLFAHTLLAQPTWILEDFEKFKEGEVPKHGWEARDGDPAKVYQVAFEGTNHFLMAKDKTESVQLFRKGGWDLAKFPYLSWKWRVHAFPTGADERVAGKNDSAAGLYVVFPRRWLVPESIKYVWSATAPADTTVRRSSHFPIYVVRTGSKDLGKWVDEIRNVKSDYEKIFGRKAPKPVAIGFLTDANDVKGEASADYDDIIAAASSSDSQRDHPKTGETR